MEAFRACCGEVAVSIPMPPLSFEPTRSASVFRSRWAICLAPAVRACLCSLLGHGALLVALAMSYAAATRGSPGGLSLAGGVSEPSELEAFAELDSKPLESEAEPIYLSAGAFDAGSVQVPIAEFGRPVQPAPVSGSPGGADLLEALSAELTAGMQSSKRLSNSANFYGIEAGGDDFVFVVDMSGSMNGARFRRARNEVRRSIESLQASQRFFVIFFSDTAWPMPAAELLEANEKNLNATRRWLKQAQCQGGTNPLPAVLHALDLHPDAIFLLSDGRFDPEAVSQIHQAQSTPFTPIHTIGFASREGEPMLRAIAEASGGTYRFVR